MENDFICKFCGKICKNANSLRNHERLCKLNPDHQESPWTKFNKGHAPWNKGLTKETDERIKLYSERVSIALRESEANKYDHAAIWTEERCKEQSERKKKLYAEHPEKHPNRKLAGNRGKMTYPEQLVNDWLVEHGYESIHNWHYKSDKINRYVDFYVESLKLIIEIDGEYWHTDAALDKAKDEDAQAHGFVTLRIKPKDGVIKQLETYFS